MSLFSSVQFSSNSVCGIKSTILPKIKCHLLSKPKATVARNPYSIGDRIERGGGGGFGMNRSIYTSTLRCFNPTIYIIYN